VAAALEDAEAARAFADAVGTDVEPAAEVQKTNGGAEASWRQMEARLREAETKARQLEGQLGAATKRSDMLEEKCQRLLARAD
jgi:hypothetical protein